MRRLGTRSITLTAVLGTMLLMIGCAGTTRVTFNGPPGSVLYIDDTAHQLPATVELSRPFGDGYKRHDADLVFNLPGQPHEIRATGYIDVFGYDLYDADKDADNTCNIEAGQLVNIPNGATVVYTGKSVMRQPLYDLSLSERHE